MKKLKIKSLKPMTAGKTEKISTKQTGFSLVELLIVITIVGLLATIILNSLSQSRARAYDSKVKQQLSSFRTAAEIYLTVQGGYGISNNCDTGMFNEFSALNGSPGLYIAPGNLPNNTQVICQSTGNTYALKASLYNGTDYWCVDNKGASRITTDDSQATFCP